MECNQSHNIGFPMPQSYCYLNSVLQMFFSCKIFRLNLSEWIKSNQNINENTNFLYALEDLFKSMESRRENNAQFAIHELQNVFQTLSSEEDIHKCYLQILSRTDAAVTRCSTAPENIGDQNEFPVNIKTKNDESLIDLFGGRKCLVKKCVSCGKTHEKFQRFKSMPLEVPSSPWKISIEHCIFNHFRDLAIMKSELSCCEYPNIKLSSQYAVVSQYIFIYLVREAFGMSEKKIHTFIYFWSFIDIPTKDGNVKYKVISVIDHEDGLENGHYYLKALHESESSSKWLLKKNSQVVEIQDSEVCKRFSIGILLEKAENGIQDVPKLLTSGKEFNSHFRSAMQAIFRIFYLCEDFKNGLISFYEKEIVNRNTLIYGTRLGEILHYMSENNNKLVDILIEEFCFNWSNPFYSIKELCCDILQKVNFNIKKAKEIRENPKDNNYNDTEKSNSEKFQNKPKAEAPTSTKLKTSKKSRSFSCSCFPKNFKSNKRNKNTERCQNKNNLNKDNYQKGCDTPMKRECKEKFKETSEQANDVKQIKEQIYSDNEKEQPEPEIIPIIPEIDNCNGKIFELLGFKIVDFTFPEEKYFFSTEKHYLQIKKCPKTEKSQFIPKYLFLCFSVNENHAEINQGSISQAQFEERVYSLLSIVNYDQSNGRNKYYVKCVEKSAQLSGDFESISKSDIKTNTLVAALMELKEPPKNEEINEEKIEEKYNDQNKEKNNEKHPLGPTATDNNKRISFSGNSSSDLGDHENLECSNSISWPIGLKYRELEDIKSVSQSPIFTHEGDTHPYPDSLFVNEKFNKQVSSENSDISLEIISLSNFESFENPPDNSVNNIASESAKKTNTDNDEEEINEENVNSFETNLSNKNLEGLQLAHLVRIILKSDEKTCYSSIISLLFLCPKFRDFVLEIYKKTDSAKMGKYSEMPVKSPFFEICSLYHSLVSCGTLGDEYPSSEEKCTKNIFSEELGECYIALLQNLKKVFLPKFMKISDDDSVTGYSRLIHDLFGNKIVIKTSCLNCGLRTESKEFVYYLSIHLPIDKKSESIQNCVNNGFIGNVFKKDNCCSKQSHSTKTKFNCCGEYLLICFDKKTRERSKSGEINMKLDDGLLLEYIKSLDNKSTQVYSLYAVIDEIQSNSGKRYEIKFLSNEKWLRVNSTEAVPVDNNAITSLENAAFLFKKVT